MTRDGMRTMLQLIVSDKIRPEKGLYLIVEALIDSVVLKGEDKPA